MKTYESYKKSGVLGVDEVPLHWKVVNFRYLINVLTDFTANGSFGDLAKNVNYLEEGISRLIRLTDLRANFKNKGIYLNEASHNYLKKSELFGDEVLLANVGAYAGLAWIYEGYKDKASLGPNMFLLKFKEVLDKRFAYIILTSSYLHSQLLDKATSSAQPKLNKEDVKSCVIVLPSLKEQIQIAKYLDHKTQIIDALIEKKEQLIKKLQAQRQAIINEAVTKGLNPNAKMKNSGIEWLGEIPKHWEVMRVFGLCNLVRGNSSFKKDELLSSGKYVALQYGKTYKVNEIDENYESYVNDEFYKASQIVTFGNTIVVSTSETIEDLGHSVFYNRKDLGLLGGEQILLKSKDNRTYPKYLFYSSKVFLKELRSDATGVKVFRFNTDNLKNVYTSVPPVEEQEEIANFIDSKIEKISDLTDKLKEQIKKLKSYRQSIISEVVTGKIDVRDWQEKK